MEDLVVGLAVIDSWSSAHQVATSDSDRDDPVCFVKTIFEYVTENPFERDGTEETGEHDWAFCSLDLNALFFPIDAPTVTEPSDDSTRQRMAAESPIQLVPTSESLVSLADGDEPECRRATFSYNFHHQQHQQQSGGGSSALPCDNEPAEGNAKSSIGLISDILDGVVFAPVGTSEAPQLSPHTRSRSTLLSFRPAPAAADESANKTNPDSSSSSAIAPAPPTDGQPPSKPLAKTGSHGELVRANSVKLTPLTHLPPKLETLFQQELAAKVKKRSLIVQQQTLKESAENEKRACQALVTATESVKPPPVEAPEFENPLYQSLHDCLSGVIPPAPPLPPDDWHHYDRPADDDDDDDATYADIDETDTSHYKTVKTAALRKVPAKQEDEEAIYAQVGERSNKTNNKPSVAAGVEPEAIYENVEELHAEEQTYANIAPVVDSASTGRALTALILDVGTATSRTRDLSSSSGHSSDSPTQGSSPEQLSPTDSLANDSAGSVRSVDTPDSGVFGLLKPARDEAPDCGQTEPSQHEKIQLLSKTLKQFERLEELSSGIASAVPVKVKAEKSVSFALDIVEMDEPAVQLSGSTMGSSEQVVEDTRVDLKRSNGIAAKRQVAPPVVNKEDDDASRAPLNREGSFEAVLVLSNDANDDDDGDEYRHKERRSRVVSPEPNNIGARIFEDVTKKRERLERSRNEKLGLVDAGESLEKLSQKRYDVIEQMTPRKPRKTEWLLSSLAAAEADAPNVPLAGENEHHFRQTGGSASKVLDNNNDKRSGTMQLEEAPFVVSNERRTQPAQTISPPPGFETMQSPVAMAQDIVEPLLGNDDFVDVASITFKDEAEHQESRTFVQFSKDEDDGDDDDDDDDDGGDNDFIASQTPKVLDRNPAKGSHPLPALYFEPDHSSREESDDDLEASSSVSSFSVKEHPVSGHHNPTETLIEREIRLQREREEAVLRERQRALEAIQAAKRHSKTCETVPAGVHHRDHETGTEKQQRHTAVADGGGGGGGGGGETVSSSRKTLADTKRTPMENNNVISPAEIRISEEIREFKRREEELRVLREAHAQMRLQQHPNASVDHHSSSSLIAGAATEDEGLYSDAERDVCSEHNSSRVESPEAGMMPSEYSKFPHQRTQSMDSMSSGHSSGDHGPTVVFANNQSSDQLKRGRQAKSVVMPLENPSDEDVPIYRRMSKETPIEREIRLAREREEALRREKGFQSASNSANHTRKTSNENRSVYRSGSSSSISSENRNVQHRYATSVIQREIDEIAERENELLRDGKIQTTSVERIDSKVSVSGDFPKVLDTKRSLAKSSSVPPKSYDLQRNGSSRDQDEERLVTIKSAPLQVNKVVAAPVREPSNRQFAAAAAASSGLPNQAGRRNFSHVQGGQRGIMEKFLLSRGRLSQPATFNLPTAVSPVPMMPPQNSVVTPGSTVGDPVGVMHPISKTSQASVRHAPTVVRPIEVQSFKHDEEATQESVTPVRRHYATTEEKIQQEFREMQQREEELRLTRSKLLAKSQPNLLDIDDVHAGVDTSIGRSAQLRAAHSISDLLADDQHSVDGKQQESKTYSASSTVKGARRKSALIAQWESRIHQQDF